MLRSLRSRVPPRPELAVAIAGTLLTVCAAGLLARWGEPAGGVAIVLALAFVPYAGVLVWARPGDRYPLPALLCATAVAGTVLLVAPPVLSDDVFRYLWDARVWRSGIDPYLYAPDDPALAALRDPSWARINHPEIPTIYPPLAQALFAACGAIAHAPWSLKLAALAAHLGSVVLVSRVAPSDDRPALALALNPTALSESALNGHVDVTVGLVLLAVAWALTGRRALIAAALVGIASGLKLVGVVLAPLLAGRGRGPLMLAVALALLPLIPVVSAGAGSEVTSGLGQYARRWRGNEGAFAVVEGVARGGVDAVSTLTGAPRGRVRVPFAAPLLEALADTPLDPRGGVRGEKKPPEDVAAFDSEFVASIAARAMVLAFVLAFAVWLARQRVEPVRAARLVILVTLLLAPQVHPWYLAWLLPLEVAARRHAGIVWSGLVLVAYAPVDAWVAARHWEESGVARFLEHATVWSVLVIEEWRHRGEGGGGSARTQGASPAGGSSRGV